MELQADLFDVLYDMVLAFISLICSRMMINLREIGAGAQTWEHGTDLQLPGGKVRYNLNPQRLDSMELHDVNPLASYNVNESRMYFSS